MLDMKAKSAPKPPTLVVIDPSIGELRDRLDANGARLGELQRELDALRPTLSAMEAATAVVSPHLTNALGPFAVLAGPDARAAGPEPHQRAREIDAEMRGLHGAGELLRTALRDRSARASVRLCEIRRADYEALTAGVLDAVVRLWRCLAAHEALLQEFIADDASAAALDVLPTARVREALDFTLREMRQRGQRLPGDLAGFKV